MRKIAPLALALAAFGCASDGRSSETPAVAAPAAAKPVAAAPPPTQWTVQASAQRSGDAQRGRQALLNENYIGCGVPDSIYRRLMPFGATKLAGRSAKNADLPYFLTRFENGDGVSAVTPNCLGCHGAWLNNQLVIGLGNTVEDFGLDPRLPVALVARTLRDPAERREMERLSSRIAALYPAILMPTVGVNPGDHIAAVLFAHRDRKTLAWSDKPLMEPPSHKPAAVDVPAWWLLRKKNAMFYTAAGRGDHARIMMSASALCTDTVEAAKKIDAYFPDIRAYILSLEAPPYPFPIDSELAARGKPIFEKTCSRCHGTYDVDPDKETYPNLVIGVETVGTDPVLAVGSGQFAKRFVTWFNESFYGEIARLEPQLGYIAPPLDGVWATAPYFHNASVPTLAMVLNSTSRPSRWTRTSRNSADFDSQRVGWNHRALGNDDDSPSANPRRVYDTAVFGQSNKGHRFGDALSGGERAAVLEYLKTL